MNRSKLLKAMDALNLAVSGKPMVEEQGCYRIKGKVLRSSDGIHLVQAELDEDTGLDCTVTADRLYKLLKGLSVDDVTLAIDGDKLTVRTSKALGRFPLASGPGSLDSLDFAVDAWKDCTDALKTGVARCRLAASKDASRLVYNGVLVKGDSVLASDGIRIACLKAPAELSPDPIILSASAAALVDHRSSELKQWAAKPNAVYFKGNGVVYGCLNVVGDYTAKVWGFLEQSKALDRKQTFPEAARDVILRHKGMMADTLDLDREVQLSFEGKIVTVRSTDTVRYELEETLDLAETAAASVKFSIHPDSLADILAVTRDMMFSDKDRFVAFVMPMAGGEFRYLTTVERPQT